MSADIILFPNSCAGHFPFHNRSDPAIESACETALYALKDLVNAAQRLLDRQRQYSLTYALADAIDNAEEAVRALDPHWVSESKQEHIRRHSKPCTRGTFQQDDPDDSWRHV